MAILSIITACTKNCIKSQEGGWGGVGGVEDYVTVYRSQ